MISLRTLVLARNGRGLAPVGQFLYRPDFPGWLTTATANGDAAEIVGATVVDADELGRQALCVLVMNRERAPVICSEDTKFLSIDREEWVPASSLAHGEALRIPEVSSMGLLPTWGRVKRVMRAPLPDRLFMDQNRMWGQMKLRRVDTGHGAYSFATPAAWVHT